MENNSSSTVGLLRELLGFTGSDVRSTDDRESDTYATGSTTGGEWSPSSLASHSPSDSTSDSTSDSASYFFHPSITTDDFSEVTTEDFRSNTYSITAYRIVWFVLAITLVMLLSVAVVTLIVRCRRVLARRRPIESNNPVTFRFTRSSNLILDNKQKSKPSPTSSREKLNNDVVLPVSAAGKNNSENQCPASDGDLYEKDSDCGSWHLECTTFSAVNDNFDENTLNRR